MSRLHADGKAIAMTSGAFGTIGAEEEDDEEMDDEDDEGEDDEDDEDDDMEEDVRLKLCDTADCFLPLP